jgi:Domain of unknown function (DUF1906)
MTTPTRLPAVAVFLVSFLACPESGFRDKPQSERFQRETKVHLGFDRNEYPGDAAMPVLRRSFSFSGYWLTPAPNTSQSTWAGKRKILEELGFGFVLLARGRPASTVQSNAQENGIADAREAAKNAKQEGFAVGSVVFLDVEEGGRLPPQFHDYLRSWVDELARLGFTPGVYCSGMPVNDGNGRTILASDDIRSHMGKRNIVFWVLNDACPPSHGCASVDLPGPKKSGVQYATVWQFVRSPRSKETAGGCAGYANDENCYAPLDTAHRWHLDLDVASSNNPSAPQ